MKTVIILMTQVGTSVKKEMVQSLHEFLGLKNIDPAVCNDFPGCVYYGSLTNEERDKLAIYVCDSNKVSRGDLGIIFIESEDDSFFNDDHITLVPKTIGEI